MPTRGGAERAARDLLLTAWAEDLKTCRLPVDSYYIARRLGLKVYFAALQEDVSGMLAKRPGQDPEVYVNAKDSTNRQRFSCAHEIGHYLKRVTGRKDDAWGYIDRRGPSASRGTNADEIYANQFAAELLMPEERVRDLHQTLSPAAMAVRFEVSLGAMKFRLENLDLTS